MIGELKSITAIERENAVKIQRHQPEGMNVRMSGAAIILHVVSVAVPGRLSTSPALQVVRFFHRKRNVLVCVACSHTS